eukprot:8744285-Heterocapsa_arctica.AAC.1
MRYRKLVQGNLCMQPYEALLCGRGNTFFTAHAYGPQAKQFSGVFVAAIQDCKTRPFAINDKRDLGKGQVNIF